MPTVCKLCIIERGLRGSEVDSVGFADDDALVEHVESEHHIPVQRKGESPEQCRERFYARYPEAEDPATCKCPECKNRRRRDEVG